MSELINEKFRQFLNTKDTNIIFDIAKNYLEPEYVKKLLNELNDEAKEEILENFKL